MRDANPNNDGPGGPGPVRDPGNRVSRHLEESAEPSEIKAEIGRTRQKMDRTLDELSARLQPKRWIEELIQSVTGPGHDTGAMRETVQRRAQEVAYQCAGFARRHPIPTAVLAGGVALLALEQIRGRPLTAVQRRRDVRREDWMDSERYDTERNEYETPNPPRPRGSVTGRPVYGEGVGRSSVDHPSETGTTGSQPRGLGECMTGSDEGIEERGEEFGDRMRERKDEIRDRLRNRAHELGDRLSRRGEHMSEGVRRKADDMRHAAGRVSESVSEFTHRARDGVREAGDRISGVASDAAHRVSTGARVARERSQETVESHPLAVAGAMFGLGLLLGVLVPTTRREDRWFGEESDEVKRSAKRMGEDVVQRGKEVASASVAAAKEEAERQGLTPDRLIHGAEEVAHAAGEEAERRAKEEGLMPSSGGGERKDRGAQDI